MRLSKRRVYLKRRRGMSFIEVICSLVIIGMLSTAVMASVSILSKATASTVHYTALRMDAVHRIDTIQGDLEDGLEIDSLSYNDYDERSPITADVQVVVIGEAFGESLYLVEQRLTHRDGGESITTQAFLRKGCTAHAP